MSGAAQGPPGPSWWRKRPVTVQGIPWTGANADAVTAFAGGDKFTSYAIVRNGELEVWNEQERHWLPCPAGHVVMRGALGELYPVSPAALEVTYDPAGGPEAEGQAALRLAVITEIREAASCESDDGDQCPKCARHADAVLAAAAAQESNAVPDLAAQPPSPESDGTIVIGPQCFASADRHVISWRGINYYPWASDPDHQSAEPELAALRELLDEIGVMAANAPEDGDSLGLLEEIAMRIAAARVPDSAPSLAKAPFGTVPGDYDEHPGPDGGDPDA